MKKLFKGEKIAGFLFGLMLTAMSLIVVWLIFRADLPNPVQELQHDMIPQSELIFFDEEGVIIEDIANLNQYGMTGDIFVTLPEAYVEGACFCFRTHHAYFEAYIDDELIYKPVYEDHVLYTDSVGVDWQTIPLKQEYVGKNLRIRYELVYANSHCGFDTISIGKADAYMLNLLKDKVIPFILCIFYLIVGIILILLYFVFNRFIKNEKSLFWLGIMAMTIASYCSLEAQVFQIFVSDRRLIHLVTMYALMLLPMPTIMFANVTFDAKSKFIAPFICWFTFINFTILTICNLFNVTDYHIALKLFLAMILLTIITMLVWMVKYIAKQIKSKNFNMYVKSMVIGLGCIAVFGGIDLYRYWVIRPTDYTLFLRIGYIGFLLCFTFASSGKIIEAFGNSVKINVVSKLAYRDGLTGLFNRTSYIEALEKIKKDMIATGIVVMDMNDLKHVNDTFGHKQGDEMIINASKVITNVFSEEGMTVYRMGGDEFVALIQSENIQEKCVAALGQLQQAYQRFNEISEKSYKLVIAAGYSIYLEGNHDVLDDAVREADANMYANKAELKK